MARLVEILVGISALAGIATFLGFRYAIRSTLRKLARRPGLEDNKPGRPIEIEKGRHES